MNFEYLFDLWKCGCVFSSVYGGGGDLVQLFRDKSINGLLQSEVELCTYTCRIIESSGVCGTRSFHRETRDCVVNHLMSMENAYSRERHANL